MNCLRFVWHGLDFRLSNSFTLCYFFLTTCSNYICLKVWVLLFFYLSIKCFYSCIVLEITIAGPVFAYRYIVRVLMFFLQDLNFTRFCKNGRLFIHILLLIILEGTSGYFFANYRLIIVFLDKASCLSLQIKKASFADDNFSITVSKSANEVVATYTKDETGMDLVIHLPPSYPLRPVDVDCTRSLGISEVKRRKWLMSLMAFVRNQVSRSSFTCVVVIRYML